MANSQDDDVLAKLRSSDKAGGEPDSSNVTLDATSPNAAPQPPANSKSDATLDETAQLDRLNAAINKSFTSAAEINLHPKIAGYDITGRLGEGGMGVVWKATQHGTHRPVALKLMSAASFGSQRARLRFEREVDLTARLEHPHIARVYDGGERAGICYYAMEFIDGVPLDQFVREQKLSRRQILELMKTICEAVQYAHQKAVIHRDLKPANIMVDKEGRPRILDFGLAKALSDDDGQMLSVDIGAAGTPAYMSPEQAAGHLDQVDTRSDVYTLGVILFYLLSGKYPHDVRGSALEVMKRITELEPCRLRTIEPKVDRDLEALLAKALSRDPSQRYGTGGGLASDLGRYLNGEPLVAQPPTLSYLIAKRAKKYRVPIAITAAVATILVGMAVVAYVRITVERNRAIASQISERNERAEAQRQSQLAQASAKLAAQREQQAVQSEQHALTNEKIADAARRSTEVQLAESLVAQGNALGSTGQWGQARQRFDAAQALFKKLQLPTTTADLGIWSVYAATPPPLSEFAKAGPFAILPDSRTAVVIETGGISFFDLATGRRLRHLEKIVDTRLDLEQLFVAAGGRELLYEDHDGTLRTFDLSSGKLVRSFAEKTKARFHHAAISPDGRLVAQLNDEQENGIGIYDIAQGRRLRTLPLTIAPRCIAWMPDGKSLLIGDLRTTVQRCDAEDGHVTMSFRGHQAPVICVAGSPDGRRAVSGDELGMIRIWDLSTSEELAAFHGHGSAVRSLAFMSDGRTLLSAANDTSIALWDSRTFRLLRTIALPHGGAQYDTVISPDGRTVAIETSGFNNKIQLWSLDEPPEIRTLRHRGHGSARICLSNDGRMVLCGGDYRETNLVDVATGQIVAQSRNIPIPNELVLLPNGISALTAAADQMEIWSLDGSASKILRPPAPRNVWSLVITANGTKALLGDEGGMLVLWDLASGGKLATFGSSGMGAPQPLALFPDGRTVLSGHEFDVRLWDLEKGQQISELGKTAGWITCIALTSDGKLAAIGEKLTREGSPLHIWDMAERKEVLAINGLTTAPKALAFSPDSRTLLCGFEDGSIRLFDPVIGIELRNLGSHQTSITGVAFSADARLVASAAKDGSVRIWDFTPTQTYLNHDSRDTAFAKLRADPSDVASLAVVGNWYVMRRKWNWAADFLEHARTGGADVSSLNLARCYLSLRQFEKAGIEFRKAIERKEAAAEYLSLCAAAVDPLPDPNPDEAQRKAAIKKFVFQDRTDEAIEQCTLLMAKEPHFVLLSDRGGLHAHVGHYREAVADYQQALKIQQSQPLRIRLALTQLYVGDTAGYRRNAADLLQRYGSDHANAWTSFKAYLLAPEPAVDVKAVARLIESERAISLHGYWIRLAQGMAEYREGHFESAIKILKEPLGFYERLAADLFSAMALYKSGQHLAAEGLLTVAAARIRALPQTPPIQSADMENWLMLQLALREAEALIRNK